MGVYQTINSNKTSKNAIWSSNNSPNDSIIYSHSFGPRLYGPTLENPLPFTTDSKRGHLVISFKQVLSGAKLGAGGSILSVRWVVVNSLSLSWFLCRFAMQSTCLFAFLILGPGQLIDIVGGMMSLSVVLHYSSFLEANVEIVELSGSCINWSRVYIDLEFSESVINISLHFEVGWWTVQLRIKLFVESDMRYLWEYLDL